MHGISSLTRLSASLCLALMTVVAPASAGCSSDEGGAGNGGSAGDGGEGGRFPPIRQATAMGRSAPEELGIDPFVGSAVVNNPTGPKDVPRHPILDNEGDSRIHNDHYNSAIYDRGGVVGPSLDIVTNRLSDLAGICPMMAILENGYVVGSCLVAEGTTGLMITLIMFDNENLDIVAEQEIGLKPFITNAAGGAYFSVDQDENIIIGPPTNRLEQYHVEVTDGSPEFIQDYSKELPGFEPAVEADDPMLQDTVVDYEGRVWFMATDGRVGYYDKETDVVRQTDLGQELQNSMVVDDRGVYLVTYEATYRLSVSESGEVIEDWEAPYDPGTGIGGVLPGSGTSPTLLGTEDDLISLCDNADGQINLLVLDRDAPNPPVCTVPIFEEGKSATENTVVGFGDDIVVVNNSGFGGPFAPARTMNPGLERYRVLRDGDGNVTGCENVWKNTTSFGNSAQLTTNSGVIWGWGADPSYPEAVDVFYLTAASWETGQEIFRTYIGDGRSYDPITGQVHMHPDGTVYLGAAHGVIAMRDLAP